MGAPRPAFFEPVPRMDNPNEFLSFGDRQVHVDNIVRLLDFLVDGSRLTIEEADLYYNALMDHYHRGILPGFARFPLPGGRQMYFLPALTVLFDNYIDPPAQIIALRDEWMEEDLTVSTTDDDLTLDGEDIEEDRPVSPAGVIDEALMSVISDALEEFESGLETINEE